jgi:DNA-binding NarL/FixJ family response regulator
METDQDVLNEFERKCLSLTLREKQLLGWWDLTVKQQTLQLGLSESTVKTYRRNVLNKLGLKEFWEVGRLLLQKKQREEAVLREKKNLKIVCPECSKLIMISLEVL